MTTPSCLDPVTDESFAEEKAELESVIAAAFRPNSNMAQMLRYVCEKRFAGLENEIKEYSIGVEALHRPPSFDPSRDSIVRVEAHRLRSRLDSFYQKSAAKHTVRIVIPTGSYLPQFQYIGSVPAGADRVEPLEATLPTEALPSLPSVPSLPAPAARQPVLRDSATTRHRLVWIALFAILLIVAALLVSGRSLSSSQTHPVPGFTQEGPSPTPSPGAGVRILAGVDSPTFVDAAGTSWSGDRYFAGGSGESISPKAIAFARDPSIFLHRRRGSFAYSIPLNPGTYEVRLYFSDAFFGENNPDGGGEASRLFDVKANGRFLLKNFDVISDAGGSNTADLKVFQAMQPDATGHLKLEFIPRRDVAFVNAIEIIPTSDVRMVPVRIVMSKCGFVDAARNRWEPDHFYRGGVRLDRPSGEKDAGVSSQLAGERFGNFVYAVPVVPGRAYKVTFRFQEIDASHLLGDTPGERNEVFNVFINGRPVIEGLQLGIGHDPSQIVQRSFEHLRPNAQDKLILSFVPVRNYAVVNSIEIVEE